MNQQDTTHWGLKTIDAHTINTYPGPYCMSFGFELTELKESIRAVGLVNPPVVIQQARAGGIEVIAGYRRVLAVKALGWKRVLCRILPSKEHDPFKCLLLNLHDNLATRELNDMEKAMVVSRLSEHLPEHEIISRYMPMLGLHRHADLLSVYREMDSHFEHEIKEFIADRRLSMHTVKHLIKMNEADRQAVFKTIANLRLNFNQQTQFIDFILDISSMTGSDIRAVLADETLVHVVDDSRLNRPQKAAAMLRALRAMKLPSLEEAEKTFRRRVSLVPLPKGARIDFPQSFESQLYRLEIPFANGVELRRKLESLSAASGLERIGDPWKDGAA